MKDMDTSYGHWIVLSRCVAPKQYDDNPMYNCNCRNCGVTHVVSKANVISKIACPTCPEVPKSPMADVINLFGGFLGMDETKKKEVDAAFDKLNKPEFKEVYSSLEMASKSIKDVMSGNSGAPDMARKVLEVEAANLKKAFNGLIEEGKITEEEARILKTDINSSANIQKLKSVLEVMKQQQQRETKKTKV